MCRRVEDTVTVWQRLSYHVLARIGGVWPAARLDELTPLNWRSHWGCSQTGGASRRFLNYTIIALFINTLSLRSAFRVDRYRLFRSRRGRR